MTLPRASTRDYVGLMRAKACLVLVTLTLCTATWAVPKPHVITFGKWTPAKWCVGSAGDKVVEIKIRALFVDTRLEEYTTGAPHEVTERRSALGVAARRSVNGRSNDRQDDANCLAGVR